MESCLAIAEPAREELKQRLLKATQYNSAEEVERGVYALEHMLHSRCMKMPTDDRSIQSWNIGDKMIAVLEEFILDTRAYADHCNKLRRFLHYEPSIDVVALVSEEDASGWMAGLLEVQRDPNTISRVSACLPGKPATYRLTSADREALVQRISARKQWRPILVRIWVGEMERFLAIKSFTDDTDASKASPSGYVDAMWHELILDTRLYDIHCCSLLGKFIHHNPDGAMDRDRASRYACTLANYRQLFQEEPCSIAWETEEQAALQG